MTNYQYIRAAVSISMFTGLMILCTSCSTDPIAEVCDGIQDCGLLITGDFDGVLLRVDDCKERLEADLQGLSSSQEEQCRTRLEEIGEIDTANSCDQFLSSEIPSECGLISVYLNR